MAHPEFSGSAFERLGRTNPILDLIAFYVAVDPFLGPPSNLVPLLLTSHTIYTHLSLSNNTRLYADIFRHKFDCLALERRLSNRWTSAPCLAQELRNRFIALKYIRSGGISPLSNRDALWRAYLMMLENDGHNEQQLFEWAHLPRWVSNAVALRTSLGHRNSDFLSRAEEGTSLAIWLLWMTSTKENVGSEDTTTRNVLLNAVLPFLVRGYQFTSAFAPDAYFYLPLGPDDDEVTGLSGPPPTSSKLHYCGHRLTLAVPPLTSAALLTFVVRREATQDNVPLPHVLSELPATRADAIAGGLPSPALTQEDVREFHFGTRTHFFDRNHTYKGTASEQLDADWFRLVACHKPRAIERPLKGIMYPLGTLAGNWCGRILVPDIHRHMNAIMDPRLPPMSVPLVQERIACRFEEHHCLTSNDPLVAPPCPSGLSGEDILNAWLPRDLRISRRAGGLQIFDPSTGKDTWYDTYHPNRSLPYSANACERLRKEADNEWRSQSPPPGVPEEDAESADEYEDFVEEKLSGVQDIIITGEVSLS
ncbi:hypothetical protein F5I97DRAFT_1500273 [Phlebopus sp. FC_14]|nr:hypothetical protein F5I97DRAFT_1500273 [Phlebopus sp. FC_14]